MKRSFDGQAAVRVHERLIVLPVSMHRFKDLRLSSKIDDYNRSAQRRPGQQVIYRLEIQASKAHYLHLTMNQNRFIEQAASISFGLLLFET